MGTNNLAETNPELAREWHPGLNGELSPSQVSPGSHKKVWWLGECGHSWQASLNHRSTNKSGCPFCSGHRVLAGFNDLNTREPKLAKEWHPALNGELESKNVAAVSRLIVWWLGECGHSWQAQIAARRNGTSCPFCSGNRVLEGVNDLSSTHPGIAQEWHPVLNGEVTPRDVSKGSNKKVWWLGECGHSYEQRILNRAVSGQGCSICAGKTILLGFNDLASVFPALANDWHPQLNGRLEPTGISPNSHRSVWWLGECGHEWRVAVSSRARGRSCPFCVGKRVLEGFNDLAFTTPAIAKQWHPSRNGELQPREVTAGSHRSVWWLGECGHEWRAEVKSRALGTNGCAKCAVGGFSSANPGLLYFISHQSHQAFKVGITNTGSKTDRLKHFQRLGWRVIQTWESESGLEIQETEKQFFRWLRKEIKAPTMLGKAEMGAPAGASETFSNSILSDAEVIGKIEQLLAQAQS